MKRFLLPAIFMAVLSGCDNPEYPVGRTRCYDIEVNTPVLTKAGWDGAEIVWENADKIGLYVNTECNVPFVFKEGNTFTGELDADIPDGSTYYVYYPYGDAEFLGRTLTFAFPDVQIYPDDEVGYSNLPMVGKWVGDNDNMTFNMQALYSFVRIPLVLSADESDDLRIIGIELRAAGNKAIAGDIKVDMGGDWFSPDLSLLDKESITLSTEAGGGVLLSKTAAKDFYIAVPPVTLEDGFVITVATDKFSVEFHVTEEVRLAGNSVYSMDELTVAMPMIIPDADFRAVLEEWGVIEVLDTSSGLVRITEAGKTANRFNFRGYGFSDMTGIEYFPTLTELGCEAVGVSKIDVSKLVNLKKLYCRNNFLTELDISHNTELEEIDCAENDLTQLDVSNNTKLVYLRFESNEISNIDISMLAELNDLIAYENLITEVDFSGNPKLMTIDLSHNPLRMVDVSGNPLLSRLDICETPIEEVDISNCRNLTALCFKEIPGSGWGGVEYVNSILFDDTIDLSEAPTTLVRFTCDDITEYSYEYEGVYYWTWRNLVCTGNAAIEEFSFRNCKGIESIKVTDVPKLRSLDITGTEISDVNIDVDDTVKIIR